MQTNCSARMRSQDGGVLHSCSNSERAPEMLGELRTQWGEKKEANLKPVDGSILLHSSGPNRKRLHLAGLIKANRD